jgi:hypothetical protein
MIVFETITDSQNEDFTAHLITHYVTTIQQLTIEKRTC